MNATIDSLWAATLNTMRGLNYAVRGERAVRQEVTVFVVALPVGVVIAPSIAWYVDDLRAARPARRRTA